MRRILFILLCLILFVCLFSCTYNPPEGYTEEHHTYEEVLEFAKTIDPNASVSKEFTDTAIDDWNRKFREYPAVINGVECNVSSVGDLVWNDGFLAGEFARQYYVIDTDYDFLVLQQLVSEKQPRWSMKYDNINSRYNWNNMIFVSIATDNTRELTDEELDIVWKQAEEIYSIYSNQPIRKTACFCLSAPVKYYNHNGEGGDYVQLNSSDIYFENFTEKDKLEFFNKYHEAWGLLESDLPVYE